MGELRFSTVATCCGKGLTQIGGEMRKNALRSHYRERLHGDSFLQLYTKRGKGWVKGVGYQRWRKQGGWFLSTASSGNCVKGCQRDRDIASNISERGVNGRSHALSQTKHFSRGCLKRASDGLTH